MRLSKRNREPNAAINMTPMIDVVFLLIVFFMTVSQVSEANHAPVQLPQLKGSKDQSPKTLTINVTSADVIMISGNAVSLTEVINITLQEIQRAGNADMVTVVLRADLTASSETVNDIVDAMSQLKVRRIRFAVQVPQ